MAGRKKIGGDGLIVTIDQKLLSGALAAVGGAVAKKTTLPILDTVLLETGQASLTLTTTNLDQEASVQAQAVVDGRGSLCVEAKLLSGIVARLKGELLLEHRGAELMVVGGRGQASLPVLPPEDFTKFGAVEGTELQLAPGALAGGIGAVLHAVSTEETRYYLNGIYVEQDGEELIFTSTDGHRLATIQVTAGLDEGFDPVILPRFALSDIMKLCDRARDEVVVRISDHAFEVAAQGECYRTKLIDGQFPDWRKVYPDEAGIRIALPRKELIEALAVAVAASREKTSAVRFSATEGRLTMVAKGNEGAWAEGVVEATDIPPCEPFGLNGKLLLQALEKSMADQVEMIVIDEKKAVRIEAGETLRQLVMPLRV